MIGERTAEEVKIKIGSAYRLAEEESLEIGKRPGERVAEDIEHWFLGDSICTDGAGIRHHGYDQSYIGKDRRSCCRYYGEGIVMTGGGPAKGLDKLIIGNRYACIPC